MVVLQVKSSRHILGCGWVSRFGATPTLLLGAFRHHHNSQKILYDRKSTEKIKPKLPFVLPPG